MSQRGNNKLIQIKRMKWKLLTQICCLCSYLFIHAVFFFPGGKNLVAGLSNSIWSTEVGSNFSKSQSLTTDTDSFPRFLLKVRALGSLGRGSIIRVAIRDGQLHCT